MTATSEQLPYYDDGFSEPRLSGHLDPDDTMTGELPRVRSLNHAGDMALLGIILQNVSATEREFHQEFVQDTKQLELEDVTKRLASNEYERAWSEHRQAVEAQASLVEEIRGKRQDILALSVPVWMALERLQTTGKTLGAELQGLSEHHEQLKAQLEEADQECASEITDCPCMQESTEIEGDLPETHSANEHLGALTRSYEDAVHTHQAAVQEHRENKSRFESAKFMCETGHIRFNAEEIQASALERVAASEQAERTVDLKRQDIRQRLDQLEKAIGQLHGRISAERQARLEAVQTEADEVGRAYYEKLAEMEVLQGAFAEMARSFDVVKSAYERHKLELAAAEEQLDVLRGSYPDWPGQSPSKRTDRRHLKAMPDAPATGPQRTPGTPSQSSPASISLAKGEPNAVRRVVTVRWPKELRGKG
jgi:hypothetical protein